MRTCTDCTTTKLTVTRIIPIISLYQISFLFLKESVTYQDQIYFIIYLVITEQYCKMLAFKCFLLQLSIHQNNNAQFTSLFVLMRFFLDHHGGADSWLITPFHTVSHSKEFYNQYLW